MVQYRDKKSDTGEQIATARKLHQICQKYGVPLLINDRVDVALAVGAEGVHLGQDDMSTVFRYPRSKHSRFPIQTADFKFQNSRKPKRFSPRRPSLVSVPPRLRRLRRQLPTGRIT